MFPPKKFPMSWFWTYFIFALYRVTFSWWLSTSGVLMYTALLALTNVTKKTWTVSQEWCWHSKKSLTRSWLVIQKTCNFLQFSLLWLECLMTFTVDARKLEWILSWLMPAQFIPLLTDTILTIICVEFVWELSNRQSETLTQISVECY